MPTFSFKFDMLTKYTSASEGLVEYLTEQTGLLEFSTCSERKLDEYLELAKTYLINELNEMGIVFVDTVDWSQNINLTLLHNLRVMFDYARLQQSLERSSEIRELLLSTITNNMDEEILITSVIEAFYEMYRISTIWSTLYAQRYSVTNTSVFVAMLEELLMKVGDSADSKITLQGKYSLSIYNHVNQIRKIAALFCTSKPELGVTYSMIDFSRYDTDLTKIPPDDIPLYMNAGNMHPLFRQEVGDTPFMQAHKSSNDHHFEYYFTRDITEPSTIQIIKLIGEYCIPAWDREVCMALISGMMEKTRFTDATKEKFLRWITDYKQLQSVN